MRLLSSYLNLSRFPVTNQSDIDFITKSEMEIRTVLLDNLREREEEGEQKKERSQIT